MSTGDAAAQAARVLGAIQASKAVSYVAIASSTLLIVDFLHTLPDEVRLMWPGAFTFPKALFYALRYYSLIHTYFSTAYYSGIGISGPTCLQPYIRVMYSSLALGLVAETITYVRVYAFSERNKVVLAILSALFIGTHIVQWYFAALFTTTLGYVPIPVEARLGCIPARGNTRYLQYIFAAILTSLSCATGIMVYYAWVRGGVTRGVRGLMRLFYNDGILYFLSLSTFAAMNIIVIETAPPNGRHLALVQAEVHIISVICGRMLLHLREWAQRDPVDTGAYGMAIRTPPSDLSMGMRFASAPGAKTVGTTFTTATTATLVGSGARSQEASRMQSEGGETIDEEARAA